MQCVSGKVVLEGVPFEREYKKVRYYSRLVLVKAIKDDYYDYDYLC